MQRGETLFVLGYLNLPTLSLSEGAIGEVEKSVDMAYLKAIFQQPHQRTEEITKILNQETRFEIVLWERNSCPMKSSGNSG
jgi:hypothetical protein